jgi:hypothetical protein
MSRDVQLPAWIVKKLSGRQAKPSNRQAQALLADASPPERQTHWPATTRAGIWSGYRLSRIANKKSQIVKSLAG